MKNIFFCSLLVIFFISIAIAAPVKKSDPVATIKMTVGDVFVQKKNNKAQAKAKMNMQLFPEMYVMTKKKSSATIEFNTGDVLQIAGDTRIFLNDYVFDNKNGALSVCFGKIKMKVKKLKKDEKIQVYTPTAVAGVRGTEFEVGVASDGSSKVTVSEGEVNFAQADKSASLSVNETADVGLKPDQTPIEKKPATADNMELWMQDKDEAVKKNPGENMKGLSEQLNSIKNDSEKLENDVAQSDNTNKSEQMKLADNFRQDMSGNIAITALADNLNTLYGARDKIVKQYNKEIERIGKQITIVHERISKAFAEIEKKYQDKTKDIDDKFKKAVDKIKPLDKK